MRSDLKNRITVTSTARAPSAEAFENAPDLTSPCCAPKENSCFKENININKSGGSNLSLEPQKMKRKKKGGKCNLRKSLAWDRAFYTEEGVLDPLELSAMSDVSCRGGLPFLSEDTPVSSSQDEDFHKDNDLSSAKLDLSSSNRMTSTSLASHKVLTNAGSKSGRANAHVGKATGSEFKLPKVPGLKPGFSPTCATTRSTILRGSHVKHNPITQPDFSMQRDVELKSSSKSRKNTQNASRPNTLQSAHHSDANSGSSSLNRHLSINMIPMTVDKANNSCSKTIPDTVTQFRPENSCDSQRYDSATFATSYSQNAYINGRTLHPLQNQTMKPSGLRMPSPSLSFFSQPKPSVFRDLPLRDTYSDVFGSCNPGSLRLLDNLSRTSKLYSKIPDSRFSSSKVSGPESTASSHVSVTDFIKPNLGQNPMYGVGLEVLSDVPNSHPGHKIFEDSNNVFNGQIQDLPKKNIIMRISHEEAELQKIGIEVPTQNGSREQATGSFLKNAIDDCPVKSESCGSEWRNAELGSTQDYAILESQTISAIYEQPEKNNTCNLLVLSHESTQYTDGFDDRVQNTSAMHSDWRKASKPDCHEAHLEKTNSLKYSLGENEKRTDKNISKEKERASEQLDVSQQNGMYCRESIKALEQGVSMAESSYFESKHLYSIEVLTDNLPAAEPHMHNSLFTSKGCKNDTNFMFEVGDDIKQRGQSPEVQNSHLKLELESTQIGKLNTSDWLLAEKQLSLQNSQQEENVDKLLLVASDRKDGNKVIDTKMPFSLSLGKIHKSDLGKETAIAQPLRMVGCDSVGNSLSSKSCNPISPIIDCDGGCSYENLSDCLHQDTRRIEIKNSPHPESAVCQLFPEDTLKKEREEVPCIQVGSADNGLTSTILSIKDTGSDIVNLKGLKDTQWLVQSSESDMLNNCCFQQSECLALGGDEFGAENLVQSNDCLQTNHHPDVYSAVNAVEGMEDSVTSQNEILQNISRSSTPSKESPLKQETREDEYGTGGSIADAITDPSRVEPFSDTIKVGISEDANNSFSSLHPKLDHGKVEASLLPNNSHGDGLEEKKNLLVVIPPNATPFSDEWLAAMEAAGEDILTRKSGAVQNSPPDKSLPEPSPWSPVKKKNNQIGPFDCTKFTAPFDS
ncbi:hypothetical protein C2S52_016576 [Perilla frutescens var. hirtella]|nr:hypothetical protein C2S52_016576 [Perilla frutescens var. hirtella]